MHDDALDDALFFSLLEVVLQLMKRRVCACGVAAHCDIAGVATKVADVVVSPIKCCTLIPEAEIAHCLLLVRWVVEEFLRSEEAKHIQPVRRLDHNASAVRLRDQTNRIRALFERQFGVRCAKLQESAVDKEINRPAVGWRCPSRYPDRKLKAVLSEVRGLLSKLRTDAANAREVARVSSSAIAKARRERTRPLPSERANWW